MEGRWEPHCPYKRSNPSQSRQLWRRVPECDGEQPQHPSTTGQPSTQTKPTPKSDVIDEDEPYCNKEQYLWRRRGDTASSPMQRCLLLTMTPLPRSPAHLVTATQHAALYTKPPSVLRWEIVQILQCSGSQGRIEWIWVLVLICCGLPSMCI